MLGIERGGPRPADEPPRRRRWDAVNIGFDALAITAAVLLVVLGALNLYAISGWGSAIRQLAVAAPGLVLFVLLRRVRMERLGRLGWGTYGLSLALLAAVPFVGMATKGARRWIGAGAFSFQPSELAKLGLLLVLAHVLSSDRPPGKRFLMAVGLWAAPTSLVLLQPDLSTAILLTALFVATLILARIPWRYLLPPLGAAVIAAPLALPLLREYQIQRLQGFFSGSSEIAGGYTLQQAHIALASGGWTGRFGDGSRELLADYLPENHTDLAFASVAQQFGLVAGLLAVAITLLIVWRMALAGRGSRTGVGMVVDGGVCDIFVPQVAISMSGILRLLPTAGNPFPLVSQVGSSAEVYLATFADFISAPRQFYRRQL